MLLNHNNGFYVGGEVFAFAQKVLASGLSAKQRKLRKWREVQSCVLSNFQCVHSNWFITDCFWLQGCPDPETVSPSKCLLWILTPTWLQRRFSYRQANEPTYGDTCIGIHKPMHSNLSTHMQAQEKPHSECILSVITDEGWTHEAFAVPLALCCDCWMQLWCYLSCCTPLAICIISFTLTWEQDLCQGDELIPSKIHYPLWPLSLNDILKNLLQKLASLKCTYHCWEASFIYSTSSNGWQWQ